jgi:hypothetical protein
MIVRARCLIGALWAPSWKARQRADRLPRKKAPLSQGKEDYGDAPEVRVVGYSSIYRVSAGVIMESYFADVQCGGKTASNLGCGRMVCDPPINATVEAVDLRHVAARDRTDLRKAQVNWGRPSGRPFGQECSLSSGCAGRGLNAGSRQSKWEPERRSSTDRGPTAGPNFWRAPTASKSLIGVNQDIGAGHRRRLRQIDALERLKFY